MPFCTWEGKGATIYKTGGLPGRGVDRGARSRNIGGGANGGKEVTFICLASLGKNVPKRGRGGAKSNGGGER